jgi:Uma2 family endonuclease
MNVVLRTPRMTRDEFLTWAEVQRARYEFDGFVPVAMTGGTVGHSRIIRNIHAAPGSRLKGSGCEPLGPDAGVATVGDAVRYPDALVTCTRAQSTDRLVPGVVVVFEVLSPSSGRVDRIEKLLEYRAVPTIRRYVILEYSGAGMTVHTRANGEAPWTTTALTGDDVLSMPEIGIDVPVAAFYEGTDLAGDVAGGPEPDDAPPRPHCPRSSTTPSHLAGSRAGRFPGSWPMTPGLLA